MRALPNQGMAYYLGYDPKIRRGSSGMLDGAEAPQGWYPAEP